MLYSRLYGLQCGLDHTPLKEFYFVVAAVITFSVLNLFGLL